MINKRNVILYNYTMLKVIQQYFNNNTKKNRAIHWVTETKHKLHYLTVCNASLGRSQRPTDRLSAKPNFKEVWSRQNWGHHTPARQSTADCLHFQDYLNSDKGVRVARATSTAGDEASSTGGTLNDPKQLTVTCIGNYKTMNKIWAWIFYDIWRLSAHKQ